MDPSKVYEGISRHKKENSQKLDLNELDALSGGADRDWSKQGCVATCEDGSWCWNNDRCSVFDVTYDNFFATCPDGHKHVYDDNKQCIRCGHYYDGIWGDYSDR